MKTIGLTGGLGSGKSSVGKIISDLGYPVISADSLAHQVILPQGEAYQQVVEEFGAEILDEHKYIDRDRLGKLVFANKAFLKKLEGITHPAVLTRIKKIISDQELQGESLLFVEVPLLYESKLEAFFNEVWVVSATLADRLAWVARRQAGKRLTPEEAQARIEAQLPLGEKEKRADRVIYNRQGLKELAKQVKEIIGTLE